MLLHIYYIIYLFIYFFILSISIFVLFYTPVHICVTIILFIVSIPVLSIHISVNLLAFSIHDIFLINIFYCNNFFILFAMYIVGPIIIISGIPISTKINDYYNDLKNMYIIYNPYLCIDILLVNII